MNKLFFGKLFLNSILLFSLEFFIVNAVVAQANPYVSKVWLADLGNGMYKNPVLNADYSDPDAIRVGDDFFMIASSFDAVPGLPILQSKDLVNWTLIGHALPRQIPIKHFSQTQHGNGVWAPSIRFHNNEFYIYYPDPDFGIYLTKAKNITGPWSEPILVDSGKGLIDPCPLWDDDGKAYLIYAYAGSRAGIKSILAVKELSADGTKVLNEGKIVFDGHDQDPTVEGPKFYKRNGYYYIFAPAGGVATGWQLVLRSKNIYGPYERKVVMNQGSTTINGPHQGAWVNTSSGEDWFLHFQDKGVLGRVVHLQPMKWLKDWPIIGLDKNNLGIGNPVLEHKKPNVGKNYPIQTPEESDEFNAISLGLQWQWQANPQAYWSFLFPQKGCLRLYAQPVSDDMKNLWDVPNVLLQKFPADNFTVTTKVSFSPNQKFLGEKAGLVVMGMDYGFVGIKAKNDGNYLVFGICEKADKGNEETEREITKITSEWIYWRMKYSSDNTCVFSYSTDNKKYIEVGRMKAKEGKWIGAKVGLFITSQQKSNDAGFVDVDWFRVTE